MCRGKGLKLYLPPFSQSGVEKKLKRAEFAESAAAADGDVAVKRFQDDSFDCWRCSSSSKTH